MPSSPKSKGQICGLKKKAPEVDATFVSSTQQQASLTLTEQHFSLELIHLVQHKTGSHRCIYKNEKGHCRDRGHTTRGQTAVA